MDSILNKDIELIKDPKPEQRCSFCYSAVNNPLRYGDMYKYKHITAHYFCVLMSSQLQQKGEDDEGFFGFLIQDLDKELNRAKSVKCCFCKRGGATAQCNFKSPNKQKCQLTFHLTCGVTQGTLHYFFGKFQSLCHMHRRPQRVPTEYIKDSAVQCLICFDFIQDVNSTSSSLWAPCCKKYYFHKDCVQRLAYSSGEYHFRCPLCNNQDKFKQAMLRCGIFLPIRDAEWEREPNAFSELYIEHNQCDKEPCLCPHSNKDGNKRLYNKGAWDLIRCSTCGSEGTHRPCSGLPLSGDVTWDCASCRQVIKRQTESASGENLTPCEDDMEEQSVEPDTCSAHFCTCNKGRDYMNTKGMYRTVYCEDCELSWIHARCRNVEQRGTSDLTEKGNTPWTCRDCLTSDSEDTSAAPVQTTSLSADTAAIEEKTKKTTRIRIHKTRNTLQDYPTPSSYQNTEPNASSSPGSSSISEKNVAGAIRIPGPKSISYGSSGPSSISETSTPEASRIPGPNSISKSGSISEETPVPRKIPGPKSISNRSPGPKSSKRISGPKSISNPSSVPSTEYGANVDAVVSKDVAKSPDLNNPKRRRGRSSKNITKPSPSSSPSLSTNPSSPQSSVSSPLPISPVISPPLKQEPSPLKTEQPKATKPKSRLPSTPTSKNKLPQSLSENVPSDTELKTELPQTPVPSSPTTNKSGLPASKTALPRSKPAKKKLPKIPKRAMKLTEMLTAYVSSLPSIPSILKSNLQPGSTSTSKPPPSPRTRLPDESKLPTDSIGKSTLPSVSTDANKLVATSTDGSKPPLVSTGRKAKVLGTPVVENKVPSCKTESSGSILILPICTKIIEGKPLNTSFEIKLTPIADKSKVPANSADKLLPKSTNKSKPPPLVPVDTDKLLPKSTNKSKPPPTVPVDLNQSVSVHPAWMDASIQKRKNLFLKVLRTYAQQYHSPSNDNHFYRYYLEELMNQFQLPELRRLYIKTKMKLLKKSLNQELLDTFPPLPSPSLMAGDEKSNASSSGGCSGLEREDPGSNPKDGEKEGNLTNPLKRPFNNELVISEAFKRARLAFSFYQKSNENNDTKTKETSDIQMDMVSSTCKFAEEFILPDDITPEFPTRVSPPRDEPRPVLPDITIEDNDLICISDDDDEVMVLSEDEKTNVVQKVEKEDEEIKVVDAKLTNHWTVRSHHDAIIPVVSIYEVPVPWVLGEPKCFKYDSERDTEPEPMGDSVLVKLVGDSVEMIKEPSALSLDGSEVTPSTAQNSPVPTYSVIPINNPLTKGLNMVMPLENTTAVPAEITSPKPVKNSSPVKEVKNLIDKITSISQRGKYRPVLPRPAATSVKSPLLCKHLNTKGDTVRTTNELTASSKTEANTIVRTSKEQLTTGSSNTGQNSSNNQSARNSSEDYVTTLRRKIEAITTSNPKAAKKARPKKAANVSSSRNENTNAESNRTGPSTSDPIQISSDVSLRPLVGKPNGGSLDLMPSAADSKSEPQTNIISNSELAIKISSVFSMAQQRSEMNSPKSATLNRVLGTIAELEKAIQTSSVSSGSTGSTIKSSSVSSDSTERTIKSSSVSSDSTGRTKSSSVSSDSTGRTTKSSSVSSDSTGRTIKSSSVSSDSTGRTIKSSSVSSDSIGRTMKSSSVSSDSTGITIKSSSVSSDSIGRTMKSSSVSSDSTGRTIKSSSASSDSTGRTIKSSSVSSDSTGRTIKSSSVSSDSTGRTMKSSSVSSAAPVIMISDDEDEDLIVLS